MTSIIDFGKHFCPGALQFPSDSHCESGSDPTLRQERAFGAETSIPPIGIDVRDERGEKKKKEREIERKEMQKGDRDREVKRRRSLYASLKLAG